MLEYQRVFAKKNNLGVNGLMTFCERCLVQRDKFLVKADERYFFFRFSTFKLRGV